MRPAATIFFLAASLLALGTAPAETPNLLLDYVGYDYEFPDPDPAAFGEPGSGYNGLGDVPVLYAPLVADTMSNQYTYYITGLTQADSTWFGTYAIITYTGGTIQVFEDSKTTGTNRDFGINPPNLVAPSTFIDGTLFLEGPLTDFTFVYYPEGFGIYEADFTATGGSQLGNIPLNQRDGFTVAGATQAEDLMPEGYWHQVDGTIYLDKPSPTEPTSWGRIKSGHSSQ